MAQEMLTLCLHDYQTKMSASETSEDLAMLALCSTTRSPHDTLDYGLQAAVYAHVPEPPGRDPEQPPDIPPPRPPDEDIDLPPREDPSPVRDPEKPRPV